MRNGRIGLAQNRLPVTARIEDAREGDVFDARYDLPCHMYAKGQKAIEDGSVAVVSLAGGAGSRWTRAQVLSKR